MDPATLLKLGEQDRFGILVTEPFGALGSGLLLSLAITSFYDVSGKQRRESNVYPEIYLFHMGGPWGCHSAFDFWPEGKEVFLPNDPAEVLRAINQFGITHLAVPDAVAGQTMHRYREPEAATNRLKQCYAYSPSGSTTDGDIRIGTASEKVIWNYKASLEPELYILDMEQSLLLDKQFQDETPMAVDYRRVIRYVRQRWSEVARTDPAYVQQMQRIADASGMGGLAETVRCIAASAAVMMLG